MIQIGCCGLTEHYPLIKEMGYDYIELSGTQVMSLSDEEFRSFLKIYDPETLPCRGFNAYCPGQYPIVGPGSGSEKVKEYAEKICIRGALLGVKTIGIGAPAARKLPEGYDLQKADREMEEFLKMICDIAEAYHITILLEAVHKYMCNYMNYTKEAVDMVKKLGLPNLAMVLDYYHAMVMGEDLHDFGYAMPLVKHLHISTDLENHFRGFVKKEDVTQLKSLLAEATAAGYEGGISIEADFSKLASDGAACLGYMREAACEA